MALFQVRSPAPEDEAIDIERKVIALLNKLTMRNFRSIADQLTAFANEPANKTDGQTFHRVIELIFDRAVVDPTASERYARLCHWIVEHISENVKDNDVVGREAEAVYGGRLVKLYIASLCEERLGLVGAREEASLSGAQPSVPGTMKFVGDLFKLQLLPDRIVHDCVKALAACLATSEEGQEVETLCSLLTSVGSILDTQEARSDMDSYFARISEVAQGSSLKPRLRFKLLVRPCNTLRPAYVETH